MVNFITKKKIIIIIQYKKVEEKVKERLFC